MVAVAENSLLAGARSTLAALARREATAVPAAEALALLENVVPPLPPVQPLPEGAPATVDSAVEALAAAAAAAPDPQAAARIAEAAAALRASLPG